MKKNPEKSRHDLTIPILESKTGTVIEYNSTCLCGESVGVGWSYRVRDRIVTCQCGRKWQFLLGYHTATLIEAVPLVDQITPKP